MPVYSMTGYASASSGPPGPASSTADTAGGTVVGHAPAPAPAHPGPASSASVNVELRSVNGRFLDLSLPPARRTAGARTGLRELIAAAFAAARSNCGCRPAPRPNRPGRSRRSRSSASWPSCRTRCRAWLPKAAPLSVNEVLHWCKSGVAPRTPGRGGARCRDHARSTACSRPASAKARNSPPCCSSASAACANWPTRPSRWCPQSCSASSRSSSNAGAKPWRQTGAAQTISHAALQERALNEAAAYAIRIDVAEELARLRAHLEEIARLLKAGGEVGKRLDFLIQELLREANTLASKAASLELTNTAVEMKVAIEQMREQVQNLE